MEEDEKEPLGSSIDEEEIDVQTYSKVEVFTDTCA